MSGRARVTAAPATLAAVLLVALCGCGKYGKPLREPPEPRERAERRARSGETRYTFDVAEAADQRTRPLGISPL